MKKVIYHLSTWFYLILIVGCSSQKINITSEYIEFLKKPTLLNSFQLSRIYVKDNKQPPENYVELKEEKFGILTDSTFKLKNKIYFTQKQQGLTWVKFDGLKKIESIGDLKENNWYLITNLHHLGYKIFVFIKDDGTSATFIDQRVNW